MTREEAVEYAKNMTYCDAVYNALQGKCVPYRKATLIKLHELLDKLEPESCEDAISRQAVLDKLNRLIEVERLQGTDEMGYGRERVSAYECMIHSIESEYLYPNIQPQPKTGHWIDDKCSVCGKGIEDLVDSREWYRNEEPNFCPFCGIKLVEQQESNDKCKNCEYYRNPDYTRCHECEAESEEV